MIREQWLNMDVVKINSVDVVLVLERADLRQQYPKFD